jgi:hypothetical protein
MNERLSTGRLNLPGGALLALVGFLTLTDISEAQPFVYQNNDLCLGFRKNGAYAENYEVVVDIGQASNYVAAAIGTTLPVQGYSASQMVPGSFVTLDDLSWSVCGYYSGSGYGTAYPAAVEYTLWVTVPRANNAVQSQAASRLPWTLQHDVRPKIASILSNAGFISQAQGTSNEFNTASFVLESISLYQQHLLSLWMGSLNDNGIGTLNDAWPPSEPDGGNLENTTPDTFNSPVRSDLYEVRPLTDSSLNPIVDPHTGTNGLAYYVGYFELQLDGSMTFTREAASTTAAPPPAPTLSIARSGNVSSITFLSTNQATYTLLYTNAAGLTAPASTWPALPATITGNGSLQTFQDTTTDASRIYRVQAQ